MLFTYQGLIVAVILGQSIDTPDNDRYNTYSTYTAMAHVSISWKIDIYIFLDY